MSSDDIPVWNEVFQLENQCNGRCMHLDHVIEFEESNTLIETVDGDELLTKAMPFCVGGHGSDTPCQCERHKEK